MKLSDEDVDLFYKLHYALLLYTNGTLGLIPQISSVEDLRDASFDDKARIRSALWEEPALLDRFADESSPEMSPRELNIVRSWRYFEKGTFVLVSYLKHYAVFVDQGKQRAYGVVALRGGFETILGTRLPILLKTVLLPFEDKITYDGFIAPYRMTFGGGIRGGIKVSYDGAKAHYGIITSLPFDSERNGPSDEDMLKFYLKNETNRERYWPEIVTLTGKNRKLTVLFHQEMGKVHARSHGRRLRDIGLNSAYFATLEGMVIAGGKTKADVQKAIRSIVPLEKLDFVYIFQLK